ncbi:MAG TPA: zinc-dependent metalloprotease [Chitinophagales bacterium]|nr:zinc-dependent metalloprotease [Chitinophagales bacterium]
MIKYLLLVLAIVASENIQAKCKKKKGDKVIEVTIVPEKKDEFKSVKEVTEKLKKLEGLFPMYQDSMTGKSYIEISETQLGKEYVYFMYVLDGVVDAGYFRGAYANNTIIKFERVFDKIEIIEQNTAYYFDPNSEIARAAQANINQPILSSEKIQAMSKDTTDSLGNTVTRYLIEADGVFLSETLSQIKPSRDPKASPTDFSIGSLSSKKSKYINLKNYPENTDVEVEYVFENSAPVNDGHLAVTNARNVSIKVRHSLIEMPDNNYQPRYDDPRVGYFLDQSTDQTTTSVTPYKDKIKRWNLVKKDSNAVLSEPLEPIVYWMENTTPLALRPIIKDAVERWNIAFEEAGFKNAVVCKTQPDTATWDAGDIRYNVLRWTASPKPPFGGYGPSFSNPRTGEILGADIMLEWIYLTNRYKQGKIFDLAGLPVNSENNHMIGSDHFCNQGANLGENLSFGKVVMDAYNFDSIQKDTFMIQCLMELVLHEVGHTLGLNHNFAGSYYASNEQWQNKEFGNTYGLSSSVMDYNIANISPDTANQGLYFSIVPGLYDRWAIRYGYTEFAEDQESEGLKEILSESKERHNLFFNDADDMRSPGKGTDPRAMLYDMTSDPITYAENQIKMNNATFGKLKAKYIKEGQSYQELKNAYLILSSRNASNFTVLTRWIGGVFVNRNYAGQDTLIPFVPVDLATQKRTIKDLGEYAFAPNAFESEYDLYNYLQSQRRGYEFRGETELPNIHSRILNVQKLVLNQLLHTNTLQKMVDSKLYGNQYDINQMLADLTDITYKKDIAGNVNSIRQQLQVEYTEMLIKIMSTGSYSNISKSAVFAEILKIKKLASNTVGDASTKAHKQYIVHIIDQYLDKK